MPRIEHDLKRNRCSFIMLEVQKAKEFPLEIKIGPSTYKIKDEVSATYFSLGMLAAIDARNIEEDADECTDD